MLVALNSCERKTDATVSEKSNILTETQTNTVGFKTLATRVVSQSDWDKKNFGSAVIIEQDIKSLTPMKEESSMYPRFTLIRESYQSAELATQRLKRLRDHDPSLDNKEYSGLVLRKGFNSGFDVLIITTDATIFSHQELDKITQKIQEINSKKK